MMPISEMTPEEQNRADESPALRKFGQAMGASRFARMMATYILLDELDQAVPERAEELFLAYAEKGGTSIDALKVDMGWARKIEERDLRWAFRQEGIADTEWSERIGLGHLRTIARAKLPDGRNMTSEERVAWLLSAYHANQSAASFEDQLRAEGRIQPRAVKRFGAEDGAKEEEQIVKAREAMAYLLRCLGGDHGPYVQERVQKSWTRRSANLPDEPIKPTSAASLLIALGESLRRQGTDIDLSGMLAKRKADKPIKAAALLEYLAAEFKRQHPGAEFQIGEEAKP